MDDDYVFVEPYSQPQSHAPPPPGPPPPPPLFRLPTRYHTHKALPPSPPDTPPHTPPDSPSTTQARELTWLLDSFQTTLVSLRHGLQECYALLAPIEAGSTLALTTPRAELVKGHVTRVGSRLVKGTIHTRLRTTAPVTLSINPAHPIHLAPLVTLNTLLTEAENLASLCISEGKRRNQTDDAAAAAFLSSQLRLLAQHIDEASAILRGAPANPASNGAKSTQKPSSRPGTSASATGSGSITTITTTSFTNIIGSDWTQYSAASHSFTPPLSRTLSFHVTIQDACLVLHLRALEPADAPVNLGIKFALAIGTARRLEHDEAEKVFSYKHNDADPSSNSTTSSFSPSPTPTHLNTTATSTSTTSSSRPSSSHPANTPVVSHPHQSETHSSSSFSFSSSSYPTRGSRSSNNNPSDRAEGGEVEKVYVREKVRVESADPSLLSMSTKLTALSNTLGLARRNLAAVMGVDLEE